MSRLILKKRTFRLGIILVLMGLVGVFVLIALSTGYSNVTWLSLIHI